MNTLRISLLQYDIAWEDKEANFLKIESLLAQSEEKHDILILPEMFSTGFSMNSSTLAEPISGKTLNRIKSLVRQYDAAIAGSFIAEDKGHYFNRGFFITPTAEYFYDKRHLFRMGSEPEHFSAGESKLIIPFRGFNICLLVCYDLRFPIWARNSNNEYDLLIYVANWPHSRALVWNTLLPARALENQAYVCGVNRIGTDATGLHYSGDSKLIDFKGNLLIHIPEEEKIVTAIISTDKLNTFRHKFPVWKDADAFILTTNDKHLPMR